MTDSRRLRRRLLPGIGVAVVLALVLAACTPEPAPAPAPIPPPTTAASRPECGSAEATAADGYALTVEIPTGRKVVKADGEADRDAKADRQRARGNRVIEVEPEVPVQAQQTDGNVDDPYFNAGGGGGRYGLWGLKRIDAPEAWGSGTLQQGQGVKVAVIDTGVQGNHPGLAGRVVAGVDLVVGGTFDGRTDGNGHGTHVAGTIAEVDNTAGGIGVAPQATIVPVRVLGCSGGGSSADVANGIYWAVDTAQVDVINLSLGTGSPSSTILTAVEWALSHDVVVVAAGGNGGASSCPPDSPVTTSTSSSTSSTTSSTSSPSSTTSPPVSTPGVEAGSATTTGNPTTGTAPTSATSATAATAATAATTTLPQTEIAPDPTEIAPDATTDAPATLDAVVIAACTTVPTFSNPLYPAGFSIGRPGLIAVAATGDGISLANPAAAGPITWLRAAGDFVEQGGALAKIGSSTVLAPEAGVLTVRAIESGTVGASTVFAQFLSADRRAPYSNVSQYLTVAAPGGGLPSADNGIFSTVPGSTYGYKSGTSMATPHVAAVAALVRSKCPSLGPAQVMDRITAAAALDDLGQAGWDPAFGAGMLRADLAVVPAC